MDVAYTSKPCEMLSNRKVTNSNSITSNIRKTILETSYKILNSGPEVNPQILSPITEIES